MNKVHNYQGLESWRKSNAEATEPPSTNHRLTKTRSSFNVSIPQTIISSIERCKFNYLSNLEAYYNSHMMEQLAGLSKDIIKGLLPFDEKLMLLHRFEEMHVSMVDSLTNILQQMLLIDFQDSNFENLFQTDPEYLSETLYRDIKYIEKKHSDLIYYSSLRYLQNILDCLQLDFAIDIYKFDIQDWAQKGLDHLKKYEGLKRQFRSSRFKKYCKCLTSLFNK